MAPLTPSLAILVSLLVTIVAADSNNYFVYPPAANGTSSDQPSLGLLEGAKTVLEWETTWDNNAAYLSQDGNDASPSLLPNSQNRVDYSYIWVVDISGKDGNPTFDLSKGKNFYFSIVQNGTGDGAAANSFRSESFTIESSFPSGPSSLTPSSASRSRWLGKGALVHIGVGLAMVLGMGV